MPQSENKGKVTAWIAVPIALILLSFAVIGGVIYLSQNPQLYADLPLLSHEQEREEQSGDSIDSSEQEEYLSKAVFVGDSRTRGMDLYGYLDISQTIAEDGINHKTALTKAFANLGDGKLYTLYQALRITDPKYIYIGFGINGMNFMPEQEFFDTYRELLVICKEACPKAKIAIVSIYPVGQYFSDSNPGMSNADIDAYNDKLKQLAGEMDMAYVDVASALKNENGALDAQYDSGDGLHLRSSAYTVVFEEILAQKMK